MSEPHIRALTTQAALQLLEKMPATQRESILRDAGDVDVARRVYPFSWIPLRVQMSMLEALRRHMSPTEWRESQRQLMFSYLERPLMRGLFDMAVRVLGLSVDTLAHWCPRAYAGLFRDAGWMTYSAGATRGEAILELDGFPTAMFASGTFNEAMLGAIETMFPLAHTRGTVTVSDTQLARGHARYTLRWSP